MSKDGQTINVADLSKEDQAEVAKQYYVFYEDGTAEMVDESQNFKQTCNWTLEKSTIVLSYGPASYEMKYEDGKIIQEADGITAVFKKV